MNSQHLSDEAVAAFADGVLAGHARERAARHSAHCPECAHAVAVQREAVWALRSAPAPSLPVGLVDRLRSVPITTPVTTAPSAMSADGFAVFSTFGTMAAAALVPAQKPARHNESHRLRPIVLTAAAVAAAGLLTVGSDGQAATTTRQPATGHFTGFVSNTGSTPGNADGFVEGPGVVPANARLRIGP
ncbi:MAG TPA: hypothetical protein VGN35_09680 [Jatrophihabitantaceae bacterium]|nr:hypothetical protein [Jatrophihabitantaceae bacterium]